MQLFPLETKNTMFGVTCQKLHLEINQDVLDTILNHFDRL